MLDNCVLDFYRSGKTIEIDVCGARAAYMTKTYAGWVVEKFDPSQSDELQFDFIYDSAREAFKNAYRFLRSVAYDRSRVQGMTVRKWYYRD